MLTERRAAILGMVVTEYIDTAEPVSSRALVARHHLDVSTATIRNELARLEEDVENPSKSQIMSKYPTFIKNHHAVHFVCDTLRMAISGGVPPFDLDQMMEMDMEVHHHETTQPISALTTVADALPGLGIVAAVLGVVITMGSLGGPPEEIGHKVAAALVGTFLGILLSYGFVGPMATALEHNAADEAAMFLCIKNTLVASAQGYAPQIAIEFGRKAIGSTERPSFTELENRVKGK